MCISWFRVMPGASWVFVCVCVCWCLIKFVFFQLLTHRTFSMSVHAQRFRKVREKCWIYLLKAFSWKLFQWPEIQFSLLLSSWGRYAEEERFGKWRLPLKREGLGLWQRAGTWYLYIPSIFCYNLNCSLLHSDAAVFVSVWWLGEF